MSVAVGQVIFRDGSGAGQAGPALRKSVAAFAVDPRPSLGAILSLLYLLTFHLTFPLRNAPQFPSAYRVTLFDVSSAHLLECSDFQAEKH